jgi:peptide/nickel transport system ATP-binding protein
LLDLVNCHREFATADNGNSGGGQKQRGYFARAFAWGDARIVVADEPVSALMSVQAAVTDLLMEIQREQKPHCCSSLMTCPSR